MFSRAFSYSLNDKIGEEYYLHTTDFIGLKFLSLQKSHQHSRGIKHQCFNQYSGQEFLFKRNGYLFAPTPYVINFIRTQISSINKHSHFNCRCLIGNPVEFSSLSKLS